MHPSLKENNLLSEHDNVFEAGPSTASQRSDGLEAADKQSDQSEDVLSVQDSPASVPDSDHVAETFHCLSDSEPEDVSKDAWGSQDKKCCFDDDDAEFLSSDSELDWDNATFDYDVIFEASLGQAIPSEPGIPDGASFVQVFAARLAHQIAAFMAKRAQSLHRQSHGACNGGVARAEQAGQIAQLVAREAERTGLVMAQEALRLGNEVTRTLQQSWPGSEHAMSVEDWREWVTKVMMEAVASMPVLLFRQMALGRGKGQ